MFNIDSIEFIRVDRVSSSLNFRSFIFVDCFLENLKDILRKMECPFVRRIVRIFILGILGVFLNEDYP